MEILNLELYCEKQETYKIGVQYLFLSEKQLLVCNGNRILVNQTETRRMYILRDGNLDIFSVVAVGYVESSQLSVDIQLDNHQINSDQNEVTRAMRS